MESKYIKNVTTVLEKRLVGNEISLAKHILSFLKDKCAECGDVIIPGRNSKMENIGQCYDYPECDKRCELNIVLCEDCIKDYGCTECREPRYHCDEHLFSCNECDNQFCEECSEYYNVCDDCGLMYCCLTFYRTDSGERNYFCGECITVIPPRY